MKYPGKLITFEGLDGCGKSTQLQLEAQRLRQQGFPVTTTHEPGGTPLGQRIRDLVVQPASEVLAPSTELALMFAARTQHIEGVLLPALQSGAIVLCDRFTDSTVAYQGYGRGLALATIQTLEELLCQGVRPDLTLVLEIDLETATRRLAARNQRVRETASRFEKEGLEFFRRVQQGYREIARQEPDRVRIVDGQGSIREVQERVHQAVEAFLQASAG